MLNVLLDSSVLIQEGLESTRMLMLSRLASSEKIVIFIPEIVRSEYISHVMAKANTDFINIIKSIESIKKKKFLDQDNFNRLKEVEYFCSNLSNNIEDAITESFNTWANSIEVTILEIDGYHATDVFDNYFSGSGAFSEPKNRNDIPDAFIYENIKELSLSDSTLFVAVKDRNFSSAISKLDNVKVFPELKELLEYDDFNSAIQEIDAESHRIQSIKEYLITTGAQEKIIDFLLSVDSDLDQTFLFDKAISDPNNLIDAKIYDPDIDNLDVSSIIDIKLERVNYIGDEEYIIDLTFNAGADFHYVTSYENYNEYDNKRKDLIDIDSINDEGYCGITEHVICKFTGNVHLIMLDKLDPKQLSIHIGYLGSIDNVDIIPFSEIVSAEILSPSDTTPQTTPN